MSMNEADTRYHLIDPVLRAKGYESRNRITRETVLTPPRGDRQGQWAVWVTGNWRLVFEFDGEDAVNVDLVDYH